MATTVPPLRLHCWINQDEKDASAQKSQVFRHIAAHKKLKRLQRTWNLRATSRLPTKNLHVVEQDRSSQEQEQNEEQKKECDQIQIHSPHHFDTQFDGSFDPFNSLPVQRTPEIDDLLQFDRLYVTPCFRDSLPGPPQSPRYLQDELAIYGYLARLAYMRGRCTSPSQAANDDIVLKMKDEAMLRLRVNLPSVVLPRLSRAAAALMYAETWGRNYAAVSVHMQLLEMLNNRYGLEMEDLISVLHSDVQRAALVLHRTEFALSADALDAIERDWIPVLDVDRGLDPCLDGTLRWLVTETRTALVCVDYLKMPDTTLRSRNAASVRYFHAQGRLLNHYHSTSDVVEKYTALAGLYRTRRSGHIERLSLGKAVVFDAGTVLLPRLQEHLTEAQSETANLRLWALFAGAVAVTEDDWFQEQFKSHAETMGLRTQAEIRSVLNGFQHADALSSQAELSLLDPIMPITMPITTMTVSVQKNDAENSHSAAYRIVQGQATVTVNVTGTRTVDKDGSQASGTE